MIHLAVPNLMGNERKYLNECIDTGFVSSVGEFVGRFEANVARASGVDYAVAVSSGTAGLHMALLACGVKPGEVVCIPSFTFIATANAVKYCGAEPWLIDIAEDSWTMSASVLEEQLEKNTYIENGDIYHKNTRTRIAAVMPVYTMGLPADMDAIRAVADRYHLKIVADAAAAIGSRYKGKNIGELADITVFSFNGNKTITCGGGGAIVCNQKEIAALARHLSTTARVGVEYNHDMVGYNNRMTNVQAAIGVAQLERLEKFIKKKQWIRAYYDNELSGFPGLSNFPNPQWGESACWFSGIQLGADHDVRRVCEKMEENNIEARTFWKPVHLQKPYRNALQSEMTVSEHIWEKIFVLPSSTGLEEDELKTVVQAVKSILAP